MTYTLITGASKGIGKALAIEAANRGHNLILVARSTTLLEKLADSLAAKNVKVLTHTADLLDHAVHRKLFDWIEANKLQVDTLINNAGMGHFGPFADKPLEKHLEVMHLNMDAMVRLAHTFLAATNPNVKRYLLNTVSTGAFQPVPNMAVYSASKSFMLSFSYALRYELRKKNVHVTALCPGGTETDFFDPAGMKEVVKKNQKFMMKADRVAKEGLDGLAANRAVVIPGWINKLGAISAKLAPTSMVVRSAAGFFKT